MVIDFHHANTDVQSGKMNLEDILPSDDFNTSVKCYLQSDDFKIISYNIERASDDIKGFIGEHYRLSVKVSTDGMNKTLSIFIKAVTPPSNQVKLNYVTEMGFVVKEYLMYHKILPQCSSDDELAPWRPKILQATEKVLVMVDMATRNFIEVDKRSYMNLEHCLAAFASIARFHASTLKYEWRQTKILGRTYQYASEYPILDKTTNFVECGWLRAGIKAVIDFLTAFSDRYKPGKNSWEKIQGNLPAVVLEGCRRLSKSDKYRNVILHGDLWANNMLFRYDEETKPVDVVLVDFQCVRYGPYGTDISGFLYLNTDRVLREEHEETMLKHYFDILNKELIVESKALTETWLNLKENFEYCRIFGLIQAMMIFPYTLMKGSDGAIFSKSETFSFLNDEDRSDIILSTANIDLIYRKRILEVIEEFVDNFVL